ncbi:MAG: DegQ family serine endoprotease [Spongiibacteraceae bacterium]
MRLAKIQTRFEKTQARFGKILSALFFVCAAVTQSASAGMPPPSDSEGRPVSTIAPLLKQVSPAVVNISTVGTQTVQNPLLNDPFFRHFFQLPPGAESQKRKTQSAGSGVIIDAVNGTVLTNHHVVDGANEITVGLQDGRTLKAKLIGSDPEVDIAVLKIDPVKLVALKLADADTAQVGDFVIAIGNPFGLNHTVTTGIVSGLNRKGLGIEGYENFIQTDASINPGNSGGALVNFKGELIGINTAIIAPGGGNVGIGFAIPVSMAKNSADQILKFGAVKRGQLGVVIQDLTADLAQAFNLGENQRGVVVAQVQAGSAAAKAGVEAGDVVISVDGKAIESAAELRNEIGARRIGDRVKVTLLRDGSTKTVDVRVGEPQADVATAGSIHQFLAGAKLEARSDGHGVRVTAIEPGSAAQSSGLQQGDVIVAVNRMQVRSVEELTKIAKSSPNRLLLQIMRGGAGMFLVLQ